MVNLFFMMLSFLAILLLILFGVFLYFILYKIAGGKCNIVEFFKKF